MTDRQNEKDFCRKLQEGKKKERYRMLFLLAMIALVLVAVFADFSEDLMLILTAVGCAGVLLTIWRDQKAGAKERKEISKALVPETLLQERFPGAEYLADQAIPDQYRYSNMGFQLYGCLSAGADAVRGIYDGLHFETCNIHFYYKHRSYRKSTVFRGPWIVMQGPLSLKGKLYVSARSPVTQNREGRAVLVGDEAFDQSFLVHAFYTEDAETILTAEVRSLIQSVRQRAGGDIYLKFYPDGALCLAVNHGKGLFFVDDYTQTAETLLNRAETELNRLADLVDLTAKIIRQAAQNTKTADTLQK